MTSRRGALPPDLKKVVAVNSDGNLYRTNDFDTPFAAGGPDWTSVDLSVAGEPVQFVVDPFSPQYLGTGNSVDGWLATTTKIYKVTDLFGTLASSEQHEFRDTSELRSMDFGVNQAGQGTCVSSYSDGVYITHTSNGGVNWSTETLVGNSAGFDQFVEEVAIDSNGYWCSMSENTVNGAKYRIKFSGIFLYRTGETPPWISDAFYRSDYGNEPWNWTPLEFRGIGSNPPPTESTLVRNAYNEYFWEFDGTGGKFEFRIQDEGPIPYGDNFGDIKAEIILVGGVSLSSPGCHGSSKTSGLVYTSAPPGGEGEGYVSTDQGATVAAIDNPPTDGPDIQPGGTLCGEIYVPWKSNERQVFHGHFDTANREQGLRRVENDGVTQTDINPTDTILNEKYGPWQSRDQITSDSDGQRLLVFGRNGTDQRAGAWTSIDGGNEWRQIIFPVSDGPTGRYERGIISGDDIALYLFGTQGKIGYSPDFGETDPDDRSGDISTTGTFIGIASEDFWDLIEPNHDGQGACDVGCYAGNDSINTGNPISVRKGEKRLEVTDLSLNTPAGPLAFTRQYRQSKLTNDDYRFMGLGWTHNHAIAIYIDASDDRLAEVVLGNGSVLYLRRSQSTDTHFVADAGAHTELDLDQPNPNEATLIAPNGNTYVFEDPSGNGSTYRVKSRTWGSNHETWTYAYYSTGFAAGKLKEVDDGYGRKLQFAYIDNANQFDHLQLWRVGDHDVTGLDSSAPTGNYVEFVYTQERLDGQLVIRSEENTAWPLLVTVKDLHGQNWHYVHYGWSLTQTDSNRQSFLMNRQAPAPGGTGTIILESLSYTVSGGKVTAITQDRGDGELITSLAFNQFSDGLQTTTETVAGQETKHRFEYGVYAGAENPLGYRAKQLPNPDTFRMASQEDANGSVTQLSWSNDGKHLDQVMDAAGTTTQFEYNLNNTLAFSLDHLGRKTQYIYDEQGQNPRLPFEVRVIDTDDSTLLRLQQFTYDTKGRTIGETLVDPTDEVTILQETTRTYYADTADLGAGLLNTVTQQEIGGGQEIITTYFYDSMGRVVQTNHSSTVGSCTKSYTVYDAAGNVLASICNYEPGIQDPPTTAQAAADLYDPAAPDQNHVTTYAYDTLGRRVSVTTNAGTSFFQTNQTVYDALSRVTLTVSNYHDDADQYDEPENWVWENGAWKDGPDGTVISHGINNNENIISFTDYNELGSIRLRRNVLGHATLYGYAGAGQLVKTIQNASNDEYDNSFETGDPSLAAYTILNDPEQDIKTEQVYDAASNLIQIIDPLEISTITIYDELNRPISTIRNPHPEDPPYDFANDPELASYPLSDDPDTDILEVTVYDSIGRVKETKRLLDTRGKQGEEWSVTRFVYDALDRQSLTIGNYYNPEILPDVYQYTEPDTWQWQNSQWEDGNGQPIDHGNNDLNLITQTVYDDAERVQSTIDVMRTENRQVYDGLGRQRLTIASFDEQASSDPTDWKWNSDNERWEYSPDNAILFGDNYDLNSLAGTIYDSDGRVEATRDVEGKLTRRVYDNLGRQTFSITNFVPQFSDYQDPNPVDEALPETWYWDETDNYWKGVTKIYSIVIPVTHGNDDANIISQTSYDNQGRVAETRDTRGKLTHYTYDAIGRQTRAIVNYVPQGSTDPADWVWQNNQWERGIGDHTAIEHGDTNDQNRITDTEYDLAGRVISTRDTSGNVTRHIYDDLGRRIRTILNHVEYGNPVVAPENWVWANEQWEDGNGNTLHTSSFDKNLISDTVFNKIGQMTSSRDARGTQTDVVYDKIGRRLQSKQAVDSSLETVAYTCYNKAGQVLRTIANWQPAYDNQQLISPDDQDTNGDWLFAPGYNDGHYNDQNRIVEYIYDRVGRRVKVIDPVGNVTETTFRLDGQVDTVTDPEGIQTLYRYDKLRRRNLIVQNYDNTINTEDPAAWILDENYLPEPRWKESDNTTLIEHSMDADMNIIVKTSYDLMGRRTKLFDPRGYKTSYEYDLLGRRTKLINPLLNEWVTEYKSATDSDSFTGETRVTLTDPNAFQTQRNYDRLGQLVSIDHLPIAIEAESAQVNQTGTWTIYNTALASGGAYIYSSGSAADMLSLTISGTSFDVIYFMHPALGSFDVIVDGLVKATENSAGAQGYQRVSITGLSDIDHEVQIVPIGANHQIAIDAFEVERFSSTSPTLNVTFDYDAAGNRSQMTEYSDSAHTTEERITYFGHDAAHRLTQVDFDIDGDSTVDETVSYEYGLGGQRTKLTLPGSLDITYTYDDKGRLISLVDWDGHETKFAYDNANRMVATERANALRSNYRYDAAGRLQLLRHLQGRHTLAHFAYEVDGRGNRTQALEIVAHPGTTNYVVYGYDDPSIVYQSDWTPNAGTYQKSERLSAGLQLAFFGQSASFTYGTGVNHSIFDVYINGSLWRSFDGYAETSGEQTVDINLLSDGPHIFELRNQPEHSLAAEADASYDETQFIVRFKQLVVSDMAYDLRTLEYTYDALSRLTEARYNPGINVNVGDVNLLRQYQYTYDVAGNRLSQSAAVNGGTPTITNYTYNAANQVINTGFTYDNNGNLTHDGTHAYTWDRTNRLTGMGGLTYQYDGAGNRIQQNDGVDTTQYLLDLQPGLVKVLAQTTNGNTDRFVHGPRGIHSQEDSLGNWTWPVTDGLGSMRGELSDTVAVNGIQHYAPYGIEEDGVGTLGGSPFRFTGEQSDDNGLLYLRARYYSPELGVFTGLDPIENLNRYQYVSSNPVNMVDPSGLQAETCGVPASGEQYAYLHRQGGEIITGYVPISTSAPSLSNFRSCDGRYYGSDISAFQDDYLSFGINGEPYLIPMNITTPPWLLAFQLPWAVIQAVGEIDISSDDLRGAIVIGLITVAGTAIGTLACGPQGGIGVASNVAGSALSTGYDTSDVGSLAIDVGLDALVGGIGGCLFAAMPSQAIAAKWFQQQTSATLIRPSSGIVIRAAWAGGANAIQGILGRAANGDDMLSLEAIGNDIALASLLQGSFDTLAYWRAVKHGAQYIRPSRDPNFTYHRGFGAQAQRSNEYALATMRQSSRVLNQVDQQALATMLGTNTLGPHIDILSFAGSVNTSMYYFTQHMMCPVNTP